MLRHDAAEKAEKIIKKESLMVPQEVLDLNHLFETLSEWERELQSLNLDDILELKSEADRGMEP